VESTVQRFRLIALTIISILVLTIIGATFLSPAYALPPLPQQWVGSYTSNLEWDPFISHIYAQSNFGVTSTSSTNDPTVTVGGTGGTCAPCSGNVQRAMQVSIPAGSTITELGADWAGTEVANVKFALWADSGSNAPSGAALAQTSSTAASTSIGWQDVPVISPFYVSTTANYWIGWITDSAKTIYRDIPAISIHEYSEAVSYASSPATWSSPGTGNASDNLRVTYTTPSTTTTTSPPIPEYPFGLVVLAILMIIGYGLVRRRAITK